MKNCLGLLILVVWTSLHGLASGQASIRGLCRTVDGAEFEGRVKAIRADWTLEMIDAAGKTREVAPGRLVAWGRPFETPAPTTYLIDGSEVAGDVVRWESESITVGIDYDNFSQRSVWEPTSIPLSKVRGLIQQPPGDSATRDALAAWVRAASAKTDRVAMLNDDEIVGSIVGIPTPEVGPAKEEDEEPKPRQLRVRVDGRVVPVPIEQIRAAAFNPALLADSPKVNRKMLLAFRDGSVLHASKIRVDGRYVIVTTTSGCLLKATSTRFAELLCFVQPIGWDSLVYLADLPTLGYRHIPFLSQEWPEWGKDENLFGGYLRAGGARRFKGVSMHSTSRIAFALAESYTRLEAELAIDDSAGDNGSVVFRVYADRGDGKFRSIYQSDIVRHGSAPVPISVDMTDVRRLALVVEFADHGDAGDHADWLNLRLVR